MERSIKSASLTLALAAFEGARLTKFGVMGGLLCQMLFFIHQIPIGAEDEFQA